MSGYGGYYGKKYTSGTVTRIARMIEGAINASIQYERQPSWNMLLKLARDIEGVVQGKMQSRYEDWRD